MIIKLHFIIALNHSEINTGLIKYRYRKLRKQTLTEVGRLRKKILFRNNEIIYLTHRFMKFRNMTLQMLDNQYQFLTFGAYARTLNKMMFFNLFFSLNKFSFKYPLYISYHYKKYKRIRVYYLGFRIIIKKRKLYRLLKGTNLFKNRYRRRRRYKPRYKSCYRLYKPRYRLYNKHRYKYRYNFRYKYRYKPYYRRKLIKKRRLILYTKRRKLIKKRRKYYTKYNNKRHVKYSYYNKRFI